MTGAVATGLFIGFLPSDWLGDGPQVHYDRLKLTCRWAALQYCHFNMMQRKWKDSPSKRNNAQVDLQMGGGGENDSSRLKFASLCKYK